MLMSEDDLVQWKEKLKELPSQCWIYDLRLGKLQHYSEQNSFSTIQATERFKKSIVFLKLLNGEAQYPDEEKQILNSIVKSHNPLEFLAAMSLVTAHKDSRTHFEGSALEQVMLSCKGPEAQKIQFQQTKQDLQALQEFRLKKLKQLREQKDEALRLQKAEQERQAQERAVALKKEEDEKKWLEDNLKKPAVPVQTGPEPNQAVTPPNQEEPLTEPQKEQVSKPRPTIWQRIVALVGRFLHISSHSLKSSCALRQTRAMNPRVNITFSSPQRR